MKEYTRAEMSEKFQTELEEAKEVARYELEQEHLENLRQLEQSLGQKHEEQLRGLAELQGKHVQEINILKAGHEAEVERLKNELAQAHSEQLSAVSLDAEREVSQVNKRCLIVFTLNTALFRVISGTFGKRFRDQIIRSFQCVQKSNNFAT